VLLGCCLHSYNDFLPYVLFEVFATVIVIDTGDKLSLTGDKLSPVSLLLAINYRRCCYWQLIFDGVVVSGVMESMKIPDKA
jgi:hypothetical protein